MGTGGHWFKCNLGRGEEKGLSLLVPRGFTWAGAIDGSGRYQRKASLLTAALRATQPYLRDLPGLYMICPKE